MTSDDVLAEFRSAGAVRTGSVKIAIFCRNTALCSPEESTKWPSSRAPAERMSELRAKRVVSRVDRVNG
jgi:hypothetical protein